jgi:hypothetical protein
MDYTHPAQSSEFEFCIALIEIYDGFIARRGILEAYRGFRSSKHGTCIPLPLAAFIV